MTKPRNTREGGRAGNNNADYMQIKRNKSQPTPWMSDVKAFSSGPKEVEVVGARKCALSYQRSRAMAYCFSP